MSQQAAACFSSAKPEGVTAEQLGGVGAVLTPCNWADGAPSGLVLHTDNMKQLPAALADMTTAHKLVYLWVYLNAGEHSARSLEADLGVSVRTALSDLVKAGVLIEESPPVGRKAGQYRAAPQRSGPRPR